MHVIKRILIMVTASMLIYFAFAATDEHQSLLKDMAAEHTFGQEDNLDSQKILIAVKEFNEAVSRAYLTLNYHALSAFSMDENLRKDYIEELDFLKKEGKKMKVTLSDIKIEDMRQSGKSTVEVKSIEIVDIQYLRAVDNTEIESNSREKYYMKYTLDLSSSRPKMLRVKTIKAEKIENSK